MIKNYWIITYSGEGLALAEKLQSEGKNVVVSFIENAKDTFTKDEKPHEEKKEVKERRLSLFDGMVKKIPLNEMIKKLKLVTNKEEHFILNDFNHNFKVSEQLMNLGIPGNFPTENDRELEIDRKDAQEFVKKYYKNLNVTESKEFKTIDEGIKFLEDTQDVWVLKGNDEDAKTRVPSTDDPDFAKEQIIGVLKQDKKMYEQSGFILQKKIKDAIEVTPEAHFYNGKLLFMLVDLELKRKSADDTGRMEGCAADLEFELDPESELAKIAFPKKVFEMAKQHKGWFIWDASILFDPKDDTPYFGEFCSNRLGYNAIYTTMAFFDVDQKHIFFDSLVGGKNPMENKVSKFSSSVRLFNENSDKIGPMKGLSISFDKETSNDLWLIDSEKKDDKIQTAGFLHDVAIVTGYGDSIDKTAKMTYHYSEGIDFLDKSLRSYKDFISKDYTGAILNRYEYLIKKKLL